MIDPYEHLDLGELSNRLGEIEIDDLESTQNAFIILIGLVRELKQEIKVLEAEVGHLLKLRAQ